MKATKPKLTVRTTLQEIKNDDYDPNNDEPAYQLVLGELKSKQSRRSIKLSPRAVAALQAHRKAQLAEGAGLGNEWNLVFTDTEGGPIHPQAEPDSALV